MGALAVLAGPLAGAWAGELPRTLVNVPLTVVYYAIGVTAFVRRPDQRAALRLLVFAVVFIGGFGVGALVSAYVVRDGTPPWAWLAAIGLDTIGAGGFLAVLALFAVFPDGVYHRPYERRVVNGAAAVLLLVVAVRIACSAHPSSTQFTWWGPVGGDNPVAVPALRAVGAVADGVAQASMLMMLAAVILLVLRYRRFTGTLRRQTAWPLAALLLSVAGLAVLGALSPLVNRGPMWVGYLAFYPVLLLLPAGLLMGILRHRLLDIDLVVRRSVVYGVLWALIAAAYVAAAAVLGVVAVRRLPLEAAIVLTILITLVVAPVRARLERLADRFVFGPRLSGLEMVRHLGERLGQTPADEEVAGTVARSLAEGLGLRWVRVVLDAAGSAPVAVAGTPGGPPVLSVPLEHHGERLGAIECGPRVEGRITDEDRELVAALGRQAALAVRNSQLTVELSARLVELEASRVRLVQAEDLARRRLERDIHDGVQQELVALLTRLAMVRSQLRREPDRADATLRSAQQDTRRALENLQEISRGIHPPILSDRGLVEAVEERASRATIPVAVRTTGVTSDDRLPVDVEGAAYFFVSESLANVLKHARAAQACVSLAREPGALTVEVVDDGRGFSPAATVQRGLLGLRDRIEALGGVLELISECGAGCRVRAVLPITEDVGG